MTTTSSCLLWAKAGVGVGPCLCYMVIGRVGVGTYHWPLPAPSPSHSLLIHPSHSLLIHPSYSLPTSPYLSSLFQTPLLLCSQGLHTDHLISSRIQARSCAPFPRLRCRFQKGWGCRASRSPTAHACVSELLPLPLPPAKTSTEWTEGVWWFCPIITMLACAWVHYQPFVGAASTETPSS